MSMVAGWSGPEFSNGMLKEIELRLARCVDGRFVEKIRSRKLLDVSL